MRYLVHLVWGVPLLAIGGIAAAIAFSAPVAPPPLRSISEPMRRQDYSDLPAIERYAARDGESLAYRRYPGRPDRVAVLVHGSSGSSIAMHGLAKPIAASGVTVYAPDLRGHGDSARRGDVSYVGQLDDDLADFLTAIRSRHPGAAFVMIGHSSGGGYALHVAGGRNGEAFSRYVLLVPALGPDAGLQREGTGGWVSVAMPRLVGLAFLERAGIHAFEGLPVIAFATAPEAARFVAPTYSYRLLRSFGPFLEWREELRRATRPITILVGERDELFHAERFAPAIHGVRQDVTVGVLPGLGHMDLVIRPEAAAAVVEAVRGTW